jgi:hypothetical protein
MRTYTVTEYDREDYDAVRENMTNDEAIRLLERIDRGWIPDYNFTGTEDDFENYKLHQALYKAMDALKGNK